MTFNFTNAQIAQINSDKDDLEAALDRRETKVFNIGALDVDVTKLNSLQYNQDDDLFFVTDSGLIIQLTDEMAIKNINIINKDSEVVANAYTLLLTDAGTAMEFTPDGGNDITIEIPENATTAFPVGTVMMIFSRQAATETEWIRINVEAGVTLYNHQIDVSPGNDALVRHGGMATLVKKSANVWYLGGALTD